MTKTNPMQRQILSNAVLVLPSATIEGSLVIEDGRIAEIAAGRRYADGLDLDGRYLIPGVIDIHTDYVEKEIAPRPEARFPLELALHYMDLRAVSCGITTVLSAARISDERRGIMGTWSGDGLEMARSYETFLNRTKARHLIHVRWDTNFEPVENALEELQKLKSVGNWFTTRTFLESGSFAMSKALFAGRRSTAIFRSRNRGN